MAERIVVTHPEWGIFIGQGFGMGFWSRQEAAGMKEVSSFATREEALAATLAWQVDDASTPFDFRRVELPRGETRASVDHLRAAGFGPHDLGQLLEDTSFEAAMDRDARRYGLGRLAMH